LHFVIAFSAFPAIGLEANVTCNIESKTGIAKNAMVPKLNYIDERLGIRAVTSGQIIFGQTMYVWDEMQSFIRFVTGEILKPTLCNSFRDGLTRRPINRQRRDLGHSKLSHHIQTREGADADDLP